MVDLYAKALPAEPKKQRVPRKCSTCADRKCPVRGVVCDWLHCRAWLPGGGEKGR